MKWLLNVLAFVLLFRLIRKVSGAQESRPPVRARRGLDPERAVRARWSEVEEDRPR